MEPMTRESTLDILPGEPAVRAAIAILGMTAERQHLRRALEEVMRVNGASGARIWWRVRSEFPLSLWASCNATPVGVDPIFGIDGGWTPVWEGATRAVGVSPAEMPPGSIPELSSSQPLQIWALIPSGTRARGAAIFWWDQEAQPSVEPDREVMRLALSAFAAQVWWRERWAQRKLERELLDETSHLMAKSIDRQELLQKILDLLGRVVHFDAGGIFVIDKDSDEVGQILTRGYDPAVQDDLRLKIGQGLVGHVAQTGELVNVPDVTADARYVNARLETRSALVVPIEMRGRRLGVFNLESSRKAAYDPNDEWLLQAFANQAAIALDRATLLDQLLQDRRLREQLAVARTIQQSFLPHEAPSIPGYDIAGVNFPSEKVGGDYFDFVPIVDGQWGLAIADVSGKGIPAALIMAGFRASLIAEIRNNYSIRTVFRKVNNLLKEMTATDNFVTAFYGVLDAHNRVLTFSNGGHNPPMLFRPGEELIRLKDGGPLMGVLRDAKYEERPLWLHPGDTLVLFTDGVTEATDRGGDEFGEARLIELVRHNGHESAHDLCHRIHEAVLDFAGAESTVDDITLVVIKVLDA